MKRLFVTRVLAAVLAITMLPSSSMARSKEHRIVDLMEHYNSYKGCECVKVGSLLITLGSLFADDDPDMQALSAIKKIVVLDLEDAESPVKNRFHKDVMRILEKMDGYDLLMEAKDDEDNVLIYSMPDADGGIKEFVVYSQNDPALIYIKGNITQDMLAEIIED